MTTNNENPKPSDNMEALKQEASACGPECGCHAGESSGRARWIVGAIILVVAGVLIVRAVIKNNHATPDKATSEFASLPVVEKVSTPPVGAVPVTNETPAAPATVAVQEISSLSDLNTVAADTGAVFIYLAGKDDPVIKTPLTQMRGAARTIEAQANIKIGLFRLKTDSPDYAQVAAQIPVPSVLAMIKGRGMFPVSGEITEPKLIQGFVAASSAGGCGPASAGCGPRGCN